MLRRWLEPRGHEVLCAAGDGLRLSQGRHPNPVLTDMSLPFVDGDSS